MKAQMTEPHLTIVCPKTGVEIFIARTNGGKGRINNVKVYDTNGDLQTNIVIGLNGNSVEAYQNINGEFKAD